MKRGISPLLASVLLVFIVVTLAIIVMSFYQGFVQEKTKDVSGSSNLLDYCTYGINLEFELPCEYNNNASLKIKNSGEGPIAGFRFLVTHSNGNTYFTDSNISLPAFSSRRYSFEGGPVFSLINKIIITPKISNPSLVGECNPIELDIDNLPVCCLDLDGDMYDSCNPGDSPEDDGFPIDCNDSDILSWKLWKNVYMDQDLDGAYSKHTIQDYCGPPEIPINPGIGVPLFNLSPGTDCLDSFLDCNYFPHNQGSFYNSCLVYPYYSNIHGYSYAISPPIPYEKVAWPGNLNSCVDKVDNNCNGLIDWQETGGVCNIPCSDGMLQGQIPCICSGTLRFSDSGCRYCCSGSCMSMDCPEIENPGGGGGY